VLGHQVGHGIGRDVATVAGAAAGGYAGNKIQEHVQENNTYQTVERICRTEYDSHTESTGEFRVRHRLDDKVDEVVMDYDPPRRIPVKDGRLVLTAS
jgi:uncharacterized protein YcfJ